MNKIFKVIWNPATGSYSVASETAKSRGKKSGRSKLLISALVAGGLLSSFGAYAAFTGDGGKSAEEAAGGTPLTDGWIAIGKGAIATAGPVNSGTSSVAIGQEANAGLGSTALGFTSYATGERSVAMGQATKALGSRAIAIGSAAKANKDFTIALGNTAQANSDYAMALGKDTNATGLYSLAIGYNSKTSKDNAIALGNGSKSDGVNAIAIGDGSASGGDNSLALGSQSKVTANNSVALGAGSVAATDDTVSVGNSTTQRKIVNMDKGEISNTSTEAINGSQLYAISKSVSDRLGGGSSVNTNGTINAPSYALKSGTYNNVGAALTGIDEDTLHWNSTTSKFSASHGSSTTNIITNVADGDVAAGSTEAVNGSQLNATNNNVATNTTNITTLQDAVDGLGDDALQWDNGKTAFSAAHGAGTTSKITNVADGSLAAGSTDAVNGSQLKTTNDNVTTNTTNITTLQDAVDGLGDDALQWDNGKTAFSAAHGASTTSKITNVADGSLAAGSTDAVNGSQLKTTNDNVTTNTTNITNLQDAVDGLGDDALQWDSGKTAFSAAHGASTTSKITNVADGSLAAGSTDAVNGSQLKTTNDNVTTNTTNITNLQDAVDGLGDDALQWDSGKTAFSAAHGASTTSKITNVADGSLAAGSTDAVNGSQLKTTNDNVTTNTTNITNLQDAVDGLGDDALQWDNGKTAFSASHGTSTTSKITNVTAGALTAASTDAINGSQLYDFSSAIADTLGGGSTVGADGMFSAPTYTIGGTDYDNLGDALTAINASVGTSLGDALMWDDSSKSYSASRAGVTSKITNVAAGALSATSTDAVNGSQLYGVSNSVVDALGGGSTMNADGTINAPTYSIANTDYSNIGDALSAIDASLDDSLLWDASAGAFSAAHGTDTASKITNVANGRIAADSTDAVNGSQLFTTNQMITQIAGNTSNTYVEEHGAGVNYIRTNDTGLVFEDAMASGIGATAVGYNSVASATGSVAIGQDSRSNVESGVALGSGSVSDRVIVKGSRNTSVTGNGVVIGYDTTDGELLGALSIGDDGKYRQIINVADGSEAHDAVTVRQLQNAIGSVATTPTKYYHANSTAEDSLAVGEDSLAIGAKTIVNGDAGIGIGLNTLVLADAINGIAIGSNAHANHANSIAMGNGSETTRGAQTGYTAYNMDAPQNSVGEFSVGSEDGQRQITNVAAGSQDTDAVNVGQLKVTDAQVAQNTQSITNLNTQVGNLDTRVSTLENGMGDIITTGSTKYFKTNTDGVDANAQGKDSVAIGSGSIAAADNSVALGTGSEANEENTVSVGSSTNQRRITNVAAGKNDTDAVNVAQLKSSEAGSVRYATNEDGSINYTTMNLGDGKGGTTRISNVSAGVNNNDAVNYAQLKQSVQETKQYTDQRMVEMDNKLSKTESKLSGGIASAMAMTGLPQAYTPGASMTSIGGGTYNGESAVALGVSMVSANGRWVYKLQGSTNSQGEYSAAVGAGIQW
ncbi:YadA-like family protein [Escherichia albertii]|uniref:YadA-like family protein n=8 Tax=Escherichia albertii TaxID=208962 RepID=UPI00211A0565|nr:YadA-like family protein [Escherichia albertii]MCQ8912730.1 YadA-like family protein [Escherichia albertii]MCQ8921525.1 YadA-like family protein [Escherichia albertii]MCQ8980206.1 YadA-like family protein [Escherichia albertii]MCQ8993491.1 YadA-like family protein [Escherichia albertii]UUK69508.1 YadA-like family protein [Escherichia albertii]